MGFEPVTSAIIIIIIIMYRLYSATLLKDPAALYNKSDINIKSIEQ